MTEGDIVSLSSKYGDEIHLGRVVILDEDPRLLMLNNSGSYFDLADWDVEILHHED